MTEPVLSVKDLRLRYGKQTVVDNVSFDLYPGRITALIGPNGAGKSSIMRIISGLVTAEHGEIHLAGKRLRSVTAIHEKAGFFIESPDFYKNLTAEQNLKLLLRIHKDNRQPETLLEKVGLLYASNKRVRKFSKGMKQRLGIAQALIGDPSILVLDEPFNGLDPEVKQFLMKLIRMLAVEQKKAILISSHLLSELEAMSDDFVLLSEGRVYLAGHISEYKNERQKVRFWFEKELPDWLLQKMVNGKLIHEAPWCWEALLSTTETAELVRRWVAEGYPPYEIQRDDLLQSKYMEIIK
jgi:ABC-2 type transport system ATP-binding protein